MEQWREYRLDEIGTIVGGATPSTKDQFNYEGDIPWITPKDLSNHCGRYIFNGERMLSKKGYDSCSCKMLPKGSILFSSRAPIGYVAIAGTNMCTNQGFKSIIPDSDVVDNRFLYYLMLNNKNKIENLGTGTTFKEVSGSVMKSYLVSIPSLDKQKSIASLLSSLDDKIELNRRINDNLEQQAQALFNAWCDGCSETVRIGQIASNVLDYTPNRNNKVRLINSSDITEGIFGKYPLVENSNLKGHFKKRFQKGDILYSEIRPRNHHYGYVLFNGDEYVISTRLMVIRNIPDLVSSSVLYQYLLLPEVEEQFVLKTETRSGTFPQGSYADLASIRVPFAREQKNITKSLDIIREKIYLSQQENLYLTDLRDTLLPKLMSGELTPADIPTT